MSSSGARCRTSERGPAPRRPRTGTTKENPLPPRDDHILNDENIGRLIWRLSIPATVGMLVMATYGFVDRIFVGRGVGPLGIGGIAIVFPIQLATMAIGHMIGMGGASIISRALGAGDQELAERTLGNVASLALGIAGVIMLFAFPFSEQLLRLFGATEGLMPYAREYLLIILWGTPFRAYTMANNNIIRSEGRARVAMTTMLVSAGLNIVLDPIFIFGLDMGVKGAALATVIAMGCASTFVAVYFAGGFSGLRLRLRAFALRADIVRETLAIGVSSFIRMVSGSVVVVILNRSLGRHGGDIAVAAYGAIHSLIHFAFMPMLGFSQALQPIAGFNYGAKRYAKAKEALRIATVRSTVVGLAAYALLMIFAGPLMRVFGDNPELIRIGVPMLRIVIAVFPVVAFQLMGASLLQAHGRALSAFILSLSRQIIILIPLILILGPRFGVKGIAAAFPISDLVSAAVAIVLLVAEVRFLNRMEAESSPIPVAASSSTPSAS